LAGANSLTRQICGQHRALARLEALGTLLSPAREMLAPHLTARGQISTLLR